MTALCYFRSLTCLWLLSWTTSTTLHVIGQFLVHIIWMSLYDFGQSTILKQSMLENEMLNFRKISVFLSKTTVIISRVKT